MKVKIKDWNKPLTKKEQATAKAAMKLMNSKERDRYQRERVVYWDTDTQRMAP